MLIKGAKQSVVVLCLRAHGHGAEPRRRAISNCSEPSKFRPLPPGLVSTNRVVSASASETGMFGRVWATSHVNIGFLVQRRPVPGEGVREIRTGVNHWNGGNKVGEGDKRGNCGE